MKTLMRRLTFALLAPVALASVLVAQEPGKQPFSITISTDSPKVETGSDVDIRIKLFNTSDQAVDCSRWDSNGLDRRYIYDVRDEDGKSVEIPGEHHELRGGSWRGPCELAPGESTNSGSRLSALYDFSKPGQYLVQVSRYIGTNEKRGVVKSNTITITVVEPPPPAAAPQ
jgi:hypothetical protein